MRRTDGFTLVELMLAVAIFAVVAAMAYTGLSTMLSQRDQLAERAEAFHDLAAAVALMESDLRQHAAREVRLASGVLAGSLLGDDRQLQFSRAGMTKPDGVSPRIGRVGWQLDGRQLQRLVWPALDQAPGGRPGVEVVLDDVDDARFGYRDSVGEMHRRWPDDQAVGPLLAVEIWLDTETHAPVRRLILIAPSPLQPGGSNGTP